jgi:peptide deformylase
VFANGLDLEAKADLGAIERLPEQRLGHLAIGAISPDQHAKPDPAAILEGQGIGLAAPQIALSKRLLVLDVEQDDETGHGNPQVFANPEILWSSDDPNIYNEGCLSIPGHYAEIERPKIIRVKYLDYDGKQQEIEADGLLATCLQHEIDHLDGVLFIDYLSTLKRNMIIKKMKKSKKNISAL